MGTDSVLRSARIWSGSRGRRSIEGRFVGTDLTLSFTGFHPGADGAISFKIYDSWLPKFARRFGPPATDPLRVLRSSVDGDEAAEATWRWLCGRPWAQVSELGELEWAQIDDRLSRRRVRRYPGTRPPEDVRRATLRRELERAFRMDLAGFLNNVKHGFYAAVAQVATIPRADLTPEIARWAYPEIPWDERPEVVAKWQPGDELLLPDDSTCLRFAGITRGPSIWYHGYPVESFDFGRGVDVWIVECNHLYWALPSDDAGRFAGLRRACGEFLGLDLDDLEVRGVSATTRRALFDLLRAAEDGGDTAHI